MTPHDVVLLDGGMGQELIHRSKFPPSPMWSGKVLRDETHLVEDVHRDFIVAGATVVILNTYSITPERLERDSTVDDFEKLQALAIGAANSAIKSVDKNVAIAGCLPPAVASYRPEVAPSYEKCLETYRRLVDAQKTASDIFIAETIASKKEALASLKAGKESGKKTWVALTVLDDDGLKLRSGESLAEVANELLPLEPDALLLNCSKPETITKGREVLQTFGLPFGAYGNGFVSIDALDPGGTVDALTVRQDMGPKEYADEVMKWVAMGATIVGGCCEVGPAHIEEIASRLKASGHKIVRPAS